MNTIYEARGEYDNLNELYLSGKLSYTQFRGEVYDLIDRVKREENFTDEEKEEVIDYIENA